MKLATKLRIFLFVFLLLVATALSVAYKAYTPNAKAFILKQLAQYNKKNLFLELHPKEVEVFLFPPRISFYNTEIKPKQKLKKILSKNTVISQVHVFLGLSKNFKPKLSSVKLQKALLKVTLPQFPEVFAETKEGTDKKQTDLNKPIFKNIKDFGFLKKIPIDEIIFEDFKLIASLPIKDTSIRINKLFLSLSKDRKDGAYFHFITPSLEIKSRHSSLIEPSPSKLVQKLQSFLIPIFKEGQDSIDLSIQAKIFANKKEVRLLPVKIKKQDSFITVLGELNGNWLYNRPTSLNLNVTSLLLLQDSANLFQRFFSRELPKLAGRADFKVNFKKKFPKDPEIDFSIRTKNFYINQFKIGQWLTKGRYTNNQASFSKFSIKNFSGSLELKDISLNKSPEGQYSFKTTSHLENLELGQFLSSLGINEVPVFLRLTGNSFCQGDIYPKISINCDGGLQSEQLIVWKHLNDRDSQLLKVSNISATAKVFINKKQVTYDSQFKTNSSSGTSKGTINYKKGFKINYDANIEKLEQLDYVFDLSLTGAAQIKGKIKGSSRGATIESHLQSSNASLNGWLLGNPEIAIKYKKGVLSQDFRGQWNKTKYKGSLLFNFLDSQMYLSANFPEIALSDVISISHFRLPFDLTGTGTLKFKSWGPIASLEKQNFEIKSLITNGSIANEPFDQLKLDLSSQKGSLQSKEIAFTRSGAQLNIDAKLSPEGVLQANFKGEQIRLSESLSLKELGLNITSYLNLEGNIGGTLQNPQAQIRGQLFHPEIEENEPITFKAGLRTHIINGELTYGTNLKSSFQYSTEDSVDSWIKLKAQKWDLANFLSAFSSTPLPYDFQSVITMNAALKAPRSNWFRTQGFIQADELFIRRGSLVMKAKKTIKIEFKKGRIRTKNVHIEGGDYFIKFNANNSRLRRLNVSTEGKFNLALLLVNFPFLESTQGDLSFSSQIKGTIVQPYLFGSAYLQNAYLKLPNLKPSIQQLNADLTFNQNRIILNSLKANFSEGQLSGNGFVIISKAKKRPVNFEFEWSNGKLNFLDGVQTEGLAKIKFSGNEKSYLLSGSYAINGGKIEENLTKINTSQKQKVVLTSSYLPKLTGHSDNKALNVNFKVHTVSSLPIELSMAQANLKANIKGEIRATGPIEDITFKGYIKALKGGKAVFQDNTFDIKTGMLTYNNKPASQPEIYIRAQTQVEDHDISFIAQGFFKDLKLKFDSQPRLPERDIVSLLTLGYTSKDFDQTFDSAQQAEQSGVQIGSIFLQEQLGLNKTIKNKLGLKVSLTSNYNKEENASVTSIVVNKKWTPRIGEWEPKLDISAKRTLKKEAVNEIKVKYKVNESLSAIGVFENKENDTKQNTDDNNAFGIDLEYKVEFR